MDDNTTISSRTSITVANYRKRNVVTFNSIPLTLTLSIFSCLSSIYSYTYIKIRYDSSYCLQINENKWRWRREIGIIIALFHSTQEVVRLCVREVVLTQVPHSNAYIQPAINTLISVRTGCQPKFRILHFVYTF